MEFAGLTQELIRALVPHPSGKPGSTSSAIRRSVVVAAMAARNLSLHRKLFTLLGGISIAFTLAKIILEGNSASAHHIGVIPYMGLHLLYTLGLLVFLNPMLRKFHLLI